MRLHSLVVGGLVYCLETSLVPSDQWAAAAAGSQFNLTSSALTGREVTMSNKTEELVAQVRDIATGENIQIVFPTAVEGGKFGSEEILQQTIMWALHYRSTKPMRLFLSIDLVFPSVQFVATLVGNLERLASYFRFTCGPESLKINFRFLTRVNSLAVHLIAQWADAITLVYDEDMAVSRKLETFLSEDCPLCRVYLLAPVSAPYKFELYVQTASSKDRMLMKQTRSGAQ